MLMPPLFPCLNLFADFIGRLFTENKIYSPTNNLTESTMKKCGEKRSNQSDIISSAVERVAHGQAEFQ